MYNAYYIIIIVLYDRDRSKNVLTIHPLSDDETYGLCFYYQLKFLLQSTKSYDP